jgi:hypothetical protein
MTISPRRTLVGVAIALFSVGLLSADDKKGKKDDDNDAKYGEKVEASVSGVTGTVIKALGGTLSIDASSATLKTEGGAYTSLGSLRVGDRISAKGIYSSGQLRATEIKIEGSPYDAELDGFLTAISLDRAELVVLGTTIRFNSATQFRRDKSNLSPSELRVGQRIEVKIVKTQDYYLATEVETEN